MPTSTRQLHFLFIYPSPGVFGGIETLIARMCHWLVRNGHKVTLLIRLKDNWAHLLPKEVHCVALADDFPRLYYYFHAKRLWQKLNLPRPDVVKSFDLGSSWIASQFAYMFAPDCKLIAGMYNPGSFKWYYAPSSLSPWDSMRMMLPNYLKSIPENARVFCGVDQIEELQEVHGQKGILWPLPIDTSAFDPVERRPQWGKIVSVGRFSPMKEYNFYMIDVVRELRSEGFDVSWTVYGHGEYESPMRDQIQNSGLTSFISIKGSVPYRDFRRVLGDAYIFVGMGTSVLEAALLGVPNVNAIAYDREGITTGPVYQFPRGSACPSSGAVATLKVADEIKRVLRLSPQGYQEESERVRTHVEVHEIENSMGFFLQIVREAKPVRFRPLLYLANYPFWFVRRFIKLFVSERTKGHPNPSQLRAKTNIQDRQ